MKKVKTQPAAYKTTGRNEENKTPSTEKNNVVKTTPACSGSRNGSKDDAQTDAREKSSASLKHHGTNSTGAVRNLDGAHHNKHREEKSQPFSLPEQLDRSTSMAESRASEEDDSVRSSIVSQILASVRGETCPSLSPPGLSANTGETQRKKSGPPPVAARVHKSKSHSSTLNTGQAKPKQVQIKTPMDVLGDSRSAFSGDSTSKVVEHPKPNKPLRSNTTSFVSDKVKCFSNSSSNDVQPASTLVGSDLGVHRTTSCKSETSSSTIVNSNLENSSLATIPSTGELQIKRTLNNPRALPSTTRDLSNATCTSSNDCLEQTKYPHKNDRRKSETQDLATQGLLPPKHTEACSPNDNEGKKGEYSGKNGDDNNRSKLDAPGKASNPSTCKSGDIIEPSRQSMCRGGEVLQPLTLTATSEFPQNLSADSGIGSPTTQTSAVERDGGRGGGLALNSVPPDQSSLNLGPADGEANQITSTPITSIDCLAPSVLNSKSNYLRNLEISFDLNTPCKTVDSNTSQTNNSRDKVDTVSAKQSELTVSDTSQNKSPDGAVSNPLDPPSSQTIEVSTQNSTERLNTEEVTSSFLSSQLPSDSSHALCAGKQTSDITLNSDQSVGSTEGQNLERIQHDENSAPPDRNKTQDSSEDGRTLNGECSKQEDEKSDVKETNNNENVKKKNLLFADQPEIFKPGFPGVTNKSKPSFRDVSSLILMSSSPGSDQKIKGILKTSNSSPDLVQGKHHVTSGPEPIKGQGCPPGKLKKTVSDLGADARCVSFKNTHTKNTFSYHNAAFEGEIITEPSKRPSLADVVSHLMKQKVIMDVADDDNSHPYGRDSSLTDLVTGKRRDRYGINAGKLIVWLALAVMIVSLAAGIIFMSETYHLKYPDGPPPEPPAYFHG